MRTCNAARAHGMQCSSRAEWLCGGCQRRRLLAGPYVSTTRLRGACIGSALRVAHSFFCRFFLGFDEPEALPEELEPLPLPEEELEPESLSESLSELEPLPLPEELEPESLSEPLPEELELLPLPEELEPLSDESSESEEESSESDDESERSGCATCAAAACEQGGQEDGARLGGGRRAARLA